MDGKDLEKIDSEIKKLNKKLGAGFGRITIRRKNNALYARGTFPPKPGESQKWQGDFPLKCRATIPGLKDAQYKALEISSQLARDRFEWAIWTIPEIIATSATTPIYIHEWVELQKQEYISSRRRITTDTDRNWLKDYGYCYDKLPQSEMLSTAVLLTAIEKTIVGTKQRSRSVNAYRKLLQLANIDTTPIDRLRSK